ncbi:DUF2058 domain-containing protein [Haliea sp. AH-315-K21]|uniref:Nucleoprotein/polynucleotide-associated enzyme n=1 Tax=SAR86 cluster bacterium TaxID=2030880 RepID=A0A2A5C7Z9_9GAMM|nr:DUF2058 domain-containing protein [Haliea sp. AH-315-K21]PCJ39989.1 MAG: nucleoprotein/polynucleotide-associated enzyme [SAR86 cluster bacterium]
MAISLQDQLKQSGLVDDKKAKQLSRAKRKETKLAHKGKKPQIDQGKLALERTQAEKVARDKRLNLEKTQKAQNIAVAAQIKQLIELNFIARDGEEKFHFTDANKVKHIWVNEEQVDHLRKSMIAIVKLADQYVLVPMKVADKIAQRDTKVVIFKGDLSSAETNSEDDDFYADFKIPDDLVW